MKSLLKKIKNKWNNFRKLKNTINPFSINQKDDENIYDDLGNVLDGLLNITPEEEKERNERALKMFNYMIHPYDEIKINESEFKYIHAVNKENFYFKVNEIKMTKDEYEKYLSKKSLNQKLNKSLIKKEKVKAMKI